MLDHLSITTTDLDRAQAFYERRWAPLGYPRVNRRAEAIGYGVRDHGPDAAPYISIYLCRTRWCPTTGIGASARQKPRRGARLPSGGACQRRLRRRTAGHPREIQPRLLRRLRARSRRQPDRSRDAPTRGMSMNFRSDNEVGAHPSIVEAVGRAFASGSAPSYGADDWTQRVEHRLRELFEKPDLVAFPVATGTAANVPVAGLLHAAVGRDLLPSAGPHRGRRGRRAGILHGGRQALPHRRTGRQDRSQEARRGAGPAGLWRRASSPSPPRSASPRRPSAAPSTRPRRSRPSPARRIATG